MPAELFRTVVCRRSTTRRLGAVPLSIVFHAGLLVAAVTIPLIASDTELPRPHVPTVLQIPSTPVVVVPHLPPSRSSIARVHLLGQRSVPLVAPHGVSQETLAATPPEASQLPVGEVLGSVNGSEVLNMRDVEAPPPSPPKPRPPVKVGELGVVAPVKVHDQAPVYPSLAIQARVEGTVVVEAVISTTGAVENVRVVKSIPLLDAAAVEAVRQWVFTPTRLSGQPVAVMLMVNVQFKLR